MYAYWVSSGRDPRGGNKDRKESSIRDFVAPNFARAIYSRSIVRWEVGYLGPTRSAGGSAHAVYGKFGGVFIAIGALISILGNLNGGFLAASRLPFAMAEQRELPQALGRTHTRFKTPYVSIIATAVVVLILTIQSSFFTAVTIATVTRLIVYAATCLALPVFRYRKNVAPAEFSAPLAVLASVLSISYSMLLDA